MNEPNLEIVKINTKPRNLGEEESQLKGNDNSNIDFY